MVEGLEHEFLFEQEYVGDVACKDDVGNAMLEGLHYAGPYGMLPRDVANQLKEEKDKTYYILNETLWLDDSLWVFPDQPK